MAFKLGEDGGGELNEINLIPLIDIMLVLMIIFLVTATVLNPSVPLNLPKTVATVNEKPPKIIQISIDKQGDIFWDDKPLDLKALEAKMYDAEQEVKANPSSSEPTIQLRADKDSRYDTLAKVLALATKIGLTNVAFMSDSEAP